MSDPIPPGHGEHDEPVSWGGSNTYSDEEWDDFGTWLREVSMCNTAREESH